MPLQKRPGKVSLTRVRAGASLLELSGFGLCLELHFCWGAQLSHLPPLRAAVITAPKLTLVKPSHLHKYVEDSLLLQVHLKWVLMLQIPSQPRPVRAGILSLYRPSQGARGLHDIAHRAARPAHFMHSPVLSGLTASSNAARRVTQQLGL